MLHDGSVCHHCEHDPAHCNGLYFVFRPDLFVEREVFDTHVTQLLTDIESSTPASSDVIRFPGEESQHHKAEILSKGTALPPCVRKERR